MRRMKPMIAGIVLALALVAAWGIVERRSSVSTLASEADEDAIPSVTLTTPRHGPPTRSLTLPGDVHAWYQTPIFGQVSGYVQAWYKDYGARVRAGDVLATIDTPRLDEQVAEARAQLEVAEANDELAEVTAGRYRNLAGTEAVARQDVDVKIATAKAQKAEVDAARAHLAALEAEEKFKRLVAPFDGVVTARLTDVGDYVNAGGGDAGAAREELFSVADVHALRVFVSVPQDDTALLVRGVTARLTLPQFPRRSFPARILTDASAIDVNSRTVLTELIVDHPPPTMLPGAFAEVTFQIPTDPDILMVPEQSLLFRSRGMEVALVARGPDGKDVVHLQPVTLGANLGPTVQILAGLAPGDHLVANPSLGLLEGEQVRIVDVPKEDASDQNESIAAASRAG